MPPYLITLAFIFGALAGWLLRERLDRIEANEHQADDDYGRRVQG